MKSKTLELILATTSPYRKEAFGFLGLPFKTEGSNVDESIVERKNPETLVTILSQLKSRAVSEKHPQAIVIGMDSIGAFKGRILEKPTSKDEARRRLQDLSGNHHTFYTDMCFRRADSGKEIQTTVRTEIYLRKIRPSEIDLYLAEDPDYKTYALGYNPLKQRSTSFVIKIIGSHTNFLWGIPLETVITTLPKIGYLW